MNFKNLSVVTVILSLVNSIFYLLIPAFSLMLMGQTAGPIGLLNTRVAGACALGMATITWFARNVQESSTQKIVIRGNLVMLTLLTLIEIGGTLTGVLNWVGYLFIIGDSLLAIGYARLLLKIVG